MTRPIVSCVGLALVGLLTGCAARGYTAPPVFRNLTGFADDRKPLVVEDSRGCHLTVFFKNGKTRTDDLDRTLCHEAALWVEAEAALRAATGKPATAPGPKGSE